jgi:hypothetical protein
MTASIMPILQAMIVPGVMVSACSLLLLTLTNRSATITSRIRLLKQEERSLAASDPRSKNRTGAVRTQVTLLVARLRLIQEAVFSCAVAIGFFILASLLIGLRFILPADGVSVLILAAFLAGMLGVVVGVILLAVETRRGYAVIRIEADAESGLD